MSAERTDADDAVGPLWRAGQVFRALTVVYALGFQIAVVDELEHPAVGVAVAVAVVVWSVACAVAYIRGFGRTTAWVVVDVVVVCLLMLSTLVIASGQWRADHQSVPTTLWAANAVISAGIQTGAIGGGVAALAVIVSSTVAKGFVIVDLTRNSAVVILLALGVVIGMGSVALRRATVRLGEATRLAAATAERDRLSRHVHDGVLQVLALIARRGREIGGPTGDLAELAAEQERLLRALLGDTGTSRMPTAHGTTRDLAADLRARADDRVTVSAPAAPITLPADHVAEIVGAVDNALDNAARHAGADARVYVLLEDLADTVVVSVRDDGVGMAPGRLPEAAAQGRLGVRQAIVGRIEALGGSARVETAPGAGTEWEFTVPRRPDSVRTRR
ncbi:MacS family sensor histidine kinase [Williamsia deligens]|uniref:MacS family sensor histidine kinase n=1 Tax=Williamsia deligens TaxID=321325 RepID=A0ABW3G8I4_9NOCA|nr:ATP-binding protein [Williamsia deligens]MCP2194042.1 Signal transduction histidine kinase [Williamsia deligens]